jgi:hypothetical protein
MPVVLVPVVAAGTVEMEVEKELELEAPVMMEPRAVPLDMVAATVVA